MASPCLSLVTDTYTSQPISLSYASPTAASFGYMGLNKGQDLVEHAAQWCIEMGVQGDIHQALGEFFRHSTKKYIKANQTALHFVIRLQESYDGYVTPRPHHDGSYWPTRLNDVDDDRTLTPAFKVGTVLCGPGTLFWDVDAASVSPKGRGEAKEYIAHEPYRREALERQDLSKDELKKAELQLRKMDTQKLVDLDIPVIQLEPGQAARWIVGDGERAVIHSEPDMSSMPNGRIL